MDIGIGLPTTAGNATGPGLLEWARGAEEHGFSTIAVTDRLLYRNYESLLSLAAAAAVTTRITLATTIVIAPYREPSLLLKQVATLDHLSGGRLVLGLAAGGREDDFLVSGAPYSDRGRRLDGLLASLASGLPVTVPGTWPTGHRLPLLVGGHSEPAMRRAARFADGWIAGGSSASGYAALSRRARHIWVEHGRTDEPRMVSLAYFALGPQGRELAERFARQYYAFLGEKALRVAAGTVTDEGGIRDLVREYQDAGCDELIFMPCDAHPAQLTWLAQALHSA